MVGKREEQKREKDGERKREREGEEEGQSGRSASSPVHHIPGTGPLACVRS